MTEHPVVQEIKKAFPASEFTVQSTRDGIPTLWVKNRDLRGLLRYLKTRIDGPFRTLYDLTAVDERVRVNRNGMPKSDFTVVYHLLSYERNQDLRIKTPLSGEAPTIETVTDIWECANWYEREIWDLFGIAFSGHPHLRRILMPMDWKGHPLRKDHAARATEMGIFRLPDDKGLEAQSVLQFKPEEWGLKPGPETLFLNMGPHHPGTHGPLRVVLQLDGEEIVNAMPDIGFHHRGAEKMGERQTWHTYLPYTDRVDYLGGVMNNLPYCLAVEKLAGIEVPERAQTIRVMLAELFRISSHLVWYGTFSQDVGQLSPVFYMFTDRERLFDIIEAVCGGRLHPGWFRIGGVAQDLPRGWEDMVRSFLDYLPARLRDYDKLVMQNSIFKARTIGMGAYTLDEAMEWGVTGPGLRACGLAWDLRKKRPYSGYENFEFDIPTATQGDAYDRGAVRVEEIRQSLRIIEQCLHKMPKGPYKADHPLVAPPRKGKTMHDIETLINHFLGVSWGPVIPPGEACISVEATKGINGYYLISDGNTHSYRTRIRTPSFPHIQMLSRLCKGLTIADLIAILGSIDFVMADVDR